MLVLRFAPVFEVTDTTAVPEPVPAPVTKAHVEADEEAQTHPDVVVTDNVAVPGAD